MQFLQLPFSIVASLNGVHMFCKSQDVILQSTSTEDTTYVWDEFEGRSVDELCWNWHQYFLLTT